MEKSLCLEQLKKEIEKISSHWSHVHLNLLNSLPGRPYLHRMVDNLSAIISSMHPISIAQEDIEKYIASKPWDEPAWAELMNPIERAIEELERIGCSALKQYEDIVARCVLSDIGAEVLDIEEFTHLLMDFFKVLDSIYGVVKDSMSSHSTAKINLLKLADLNDELTTEEEDPW